jgi:hypothetical protein
MIKNNAKLFDSELLKKVFCNVRNSAGNYGDKLYQDILRTLRVVDAQDAIGKYKWKNIPCAMSSMELEKLLYNKGDICLFYDKELERFFFMPFTLNGTIDEQGRFETITPVPVAFDGKSSDSKSPIMRYFGEKKLRVIYDVLDVPPTEEQLYNSAVIFHDYTSDLLVQNTSIPRKVLQQPILELEASMMPYAETNLIAGTGVKAVKVPDGDVGNNVLFAAKDIRKAAKDGSLLVPLTSQLDPVDFANHQRANSNEYFLAMQSLDNLRLSFHGLENGGLFEKKAHILQSEQDANTANCGIVYQDGLSNRQHGCNIANSIWGIDIDCVPSESVLGIDDDMDGEAYDIEDDGLGDEENA